MVRIGAYSIKPKHQSADLLETANGTYGVRALGKGTYGMVVPATNIRTEQEVAIKVLDKKANEKYVTKEIANMWLLRHKNIVNLLDVMDDTKNFYLVLELCTGGSFFNKVSDNKKRRKRFEQHVAKNYFRQIMASMEHCHQRGVVHRDLKLENLLMDDNDNIKLCDFGLSTQTNDGMITGFCGTRKYMAPEVFAYLEDSQPYDGFKSDIWSLGVILYVMLACNYPFNPHLTEDVKYQMLVNGQFPWPEELEKNYPGSTDFMSHLMDPNPQTRYTFDQMKAHEFLLSGADSSNASSTQVEDTSKVQQMADEKQQLSRMQNSSNSAFSSQMQGVSDVQNINVVSVASDENVYRSVPLNFNSLSPVQIVNEDVDVVVVGDDAAYRSGDGLSVGGTVIDLGQQLMSFRDIVHIPTRFITSLTPADALARLTQTLQQISSQSGVKDYLIMSVNEMNFMITVDVYARGKPENVTALVDDDHFRATCQLYSSNENSRVVEIRHETGDGFMFQDFYDTIRERLADIIKDENASVEQTSSSSSGVTIESKTSVVQPITQQQVSVPEFDFQIVDDS